MSYLDRIAPSIDFVSPMGREFSAQWVGGNRSVAKKIGEFSPPGRAGTIYQDLNVTSVRYPLNFLFAGINHDIEAQLFFETIREEGVWTVIHPIHGSLRLQPLSITEENQPVNEGGITRITSEWVVPLEETAQESSAELASQIEAQLRQLNAAAAAQLESLANQDTPSAIQSLKNTFSSISQTISNGMATINAISAEIARITNGIQRALNSALLEPTLTIASISTQIQNLAQFPSLVETSVETKVAAYRGIIEGVFGNNPESPSLNSRNELAAKELALVSLVAAMPRIASTGSLRTKTEAIALAELMESLADQITDDLENAQSVFDNSLMEVRYFSLSQSYGDLLLLISLGIRYLLRASFDLQVERTFVLDRPRSPVDIVIDEYGGLGENEENLDLFINANALQGHEIVLLPVNRQVTVYV